MQTMYPGMPNSPQTELAQAIDDQTTTIPLVDASKLPPAPNLATIGTDETAETVLYTGKSGNNLTGVTRGFQGAAKSWGAGVKVARNFTAYDYDALRENLEDHAAATTGVHGATSAATPNTLVQRDAQGRIKAAAPSDPDDVARKAEVDQMLPKSGGVVNGLVEFANGKIQVGSTAGTKRFFRWDGTISEDDVTYHTLWHTGQLRWNPAGYLEYNDGGTWRPVGGIKKVQRGVTSVRSGTNVDVTISVVDPNKSFVTFANAGAYGEDGAFSLANAQLLNETTLRLRYDYAPGSKTESFAWEVVESY